VEPEVLPQGSDEIARWAMARGLRYEARPDQSWFRRWEPFDTMVAAASYINAVTWSLPPGSVTVAEPWTEEGNLDPIDRTLYAFASHPGLRGQAAVRVGEHFVTRVTFLTKPPPPKVQIGDPIWDEHAVTHASSADSAKRTLTAALRALLQRWGFQGHLELRPGGAVLHMARLRPAPQSYEQLGASAQQVVDAALRSG
jgi:hypothetical protein